MDGALNRSGEGFQNNAISASGFTGVDRRPFRVKKNNNNIWIFVDWALDKQNNNFARAVNFLIHFFVVTA